MNPGLVPAFLAQLIINLILIFSLVGGMLKYPLFFHSYRRWMVLAFSSLAILNSFALYFPTPFNPWSYILARFFLMLFAVDVLGFYVVTLVARKLKWLS